MTMRDWLAKMDDFLKVSDRDILTHAGRISHETAVLRAEAEFGKYQQQILAQPTRADTDFDEAARKVGKLPTSRKHKDKPEGQDR